MIDSISEAYKASVKNQLVSVGVGVGVGVGVSNLISWKTYAKGKPHTENA